MRKRSGFTLVELLAVIAIISLIMILAMPALLNTTNTAKKENFYMYAQNLNTKATNKYLDEIKDDIEKINCAVYDIGTDLDLPTTGNYEGWVKVLRTPVSSGKASVTINFTSSTPIQAARYCILKGDNCNPDTSIIVDGESTELIVNNLITKDQVMCANYDYPVGNVITKSETVCKKFVDGKENYDTYKYDVEVTLTDRNYVIQDFLISDATNNLKSNFYSTLEENRKNPPLEDSSNPFKIKSPTCSSDEDPTYKGESLNKTTIITTTTTTGKTCDNDPTKIDNNFQIKFNTYSTNKIDDVSFCANCEGNDLIPTPTREGYTFVGWYYDNKFTDPVNGEVNGLYLLRNIRITQKLSSAQCVIGYNDVTLYAKWQMNETTTTTKPTVIVTEPSSKPTVTTEVTTTTTKPFDKTDYTILLNNLEIDNYPIDFDMLKYDYFINIPSSVDSINVKYTVHDEENSIVYVQGNEDLAVGVNTITVSIFNKITGKENKYRIFARKFAETEIFEPYPTNPPQIYNPAEGLPDPTIEESNASLDSLVISGYSIRFDPNVYDYVLEIHDELSLDVSYRAASKYAIVVVTGNEIIKDNSVITVNVQSQNGYYNKIYRITLKRSEKKSKLTIVLRMIALIMATLLIVILIIIIVNKLKKKKQKIKLN